MLIETNTPATGAADRRPRERLMNSRILLLIGALVASTSVAAAAPTSIGTFKAWSAYVSTDANSKTCFAASQPTNSKYTRSVSSRGDTFFMITTIPTKKITNEASTIIGFPFKAGSAVTANVDGTPYKMFFNDAAGETAWSVPDTEPALVAAMKKGSRMTVTSTSSRGTGVTDTYSLSGVTAALAAVAKECP
jgi:invasion protein IalB